MQWKKHRQPNRRNQLNQDVNDIEDDLKEFLDDEDIAPIHNKLYFYEDVTPASVLRLNRQIDSLTKKLQTLELQYNVPKTFHIDLFICSDGGDVCASLSAADKISKNPVPIDTYCEGMVASAGTIMSVCGRKRHITENSLMLIHQLSSEYWGNFEQLKEDMKNNELLMSLIKRIYSKKTKITDVELDGLLKHDLYFPSELCLEKGLVDVIL